MHVVAMHILPLPAVRLRRAHGVEWRPWDRRGVSQTSVGSISSVLWGVTFYRAKKLLSLDAIHWYGIRMDSRPIGATCVIRWLNGYLMVAVWRVLAGVGNSSEYVTSF